MSNEILVILAAFMDLAVILIAFRLGRTFLQAAIIVNLIMVSLTAAKVGLFFGVVGSPQSIFYASIFLGTDLLTEFHGKRAGYIAVWTGFFSLALLAGLGQVIIHFSPLSDSQKFGEAVNTVFSGTWRIALASFTAYAIAQSFDVWFYHFLREKTKGKKLWLRNLASTSTSQLIDTVIFFPIAFAGVMPNLISVMIVAYIVKLVVAVLDTPYMYLAKLITPENRPSHEH